MKVQHVASVDPTALPGARKRVDDQPPPSFLGTGSLGQGLALRDVLRSSSLIGARLLAGEAGLDRLVRRLNVMEVPDILPWVKPDELLLTTGYPLRNAPYGLVQLVTELNARHLAGIAIKVGRYVSCVPPEMLAEANRLGFPILELPTAVSFDDILDQVLTGILNHQAALLARSERIHRALLHIVLAGGGLQELANEIAEQLDGDVIVEPVGAPPVLSRTRPSSPEGDGPGDSSPAKVLVIDIVASGAVHGRLEVRRRGADFEEGDRHVLERAMTVAALVVARELAVNAVQSKYRGDFLRDVLDGREGDARQIIAHAAGFGWDFSRPLVVAVVRCHDTSVLDEREERALQERLSSSWHRSVVAQDPGSATAGFLHEVVTILGDQPSLSAIDAAAAARASLQRSLRGLRTPWAVGLSRVAHSLDELPAAYMQAVRAAHVGGQVYGSESLTEFDQLGVFRLLSLIPDATELTAFVCDTLGPLADDSAESVELRHSLAVLLETGLNVAETARRLHFHYNTVRYRIDKLENMLGSFTTDATRRLEISLALLILDMKALR